MLFFVNALLMIIFPFYRTEFPIDDLPKEFSVTVYENGAITRNTSVNLTSPTYSGLKDFLEKEKSGWRYDMKTYAPRYQFDSPSLKINCLDSFVVVNFLKAKDVWVQISKTTSSSCPTAKTDSVVQK